MPYANWKFVLLKYVDLNNGFIQNSLWNNAEYVKAETLK